jgi:phenylalanyl-tRNA synthetase beta chain
VFDIDAAALQRGALSRAVAVPKTPVVRRDLAVVVDETITANDVLAAAASAKAPFVGEIAIFDVYRGTGIASGRKSLAILVLMQDTARTLTDADIDHAMANITRALADRCGGTLR